MMYPMIADWLMLFLCAILVLPWLIGALLVINDFKQRRKNRDR